MQVRCRDIYVHPPLTDCYAPSTILLSKIGVKYYSAVKTEDSQEDGRRHVIISHFRGNIQHGSVTITDIQW